MFYCDVECCYLFIFIVLILLIIGLIIYLTYDSNERHDDNLPYLDEMNDRDKNNIQSNERNYNDSNDSVNVENDLLSWYNRRLNQIKQRHINSIIFDPRLKMKNNDVDVKSVAMMLNTCRGSTITVYGYHTLEADNCMVYLIQNLKYNLETTDLLITIIDQNWQVKMYNSQCDKHNNDLRLMVMDNNRLPIHTYTTTKVIIYFTLCITPNNEVVDDETICNLCEDYPSDEDDIDIESKPPDFEEDFSQTSLSCRDA